MKLFAAVSSFYMINNHLYIPLTRSFLWNTFPHRSNIYQTQSLYTYIPHLSHPFGYSMGTTIIAITRAWNTITNVASVHISIDMTIHVVSDHPDQNSDWSKYFHVDPSITSDSIIFCILTLVVAADGPSFPNTSSQSVVFGTITQCCMFISCLFFHWAEPRFSYRSKFSFGCTVVR